MDYEQIKKRANQILYNREPECSYIEYKASSKQFDKLLKTLCAYGNNYYDNDIQYIFIGVEEANNDEEKAIPVLPIKGVSKGELEKCRNDINSLRPFLYPNVRFEIIANRYEEKDYLLVVVNRQTGGPFMVSDRAEHDRKIKLKAGRYVRIEAQTRLARIEEEYDLMRKFSDYHFSSLSNNDATVDDLNLDFLKEYISKTSDRHVMGNMSKEELCTALGLIDRNDPAGKQVKNFALLMFCDNPERFVPYAYSEMIVDMFGTKRSMQSKTFTGPIWKQYQAIVNYINDNYLDTIVLRDGSKAENRRLSNYTFTSVEELIANAIVHNNYENRKAVQIYVSETMINIVNYNRPLPPLQISDLNSRSFFNERDTENPEIRDMFKKLGIIESFGTGIGEAKRSLRENGSPDLFYKEFDGGANVTSVVIPVNEEYLQLKKGGKPKIELGIERQTQAVKQIIMNSVFSEKVKHNMIIIYDETDGGMFGNSDVCNLLKCSETTATTYIKKMLTELKIIKPVIGKGKGKYHFIENK